MSSVAAELFKMVLIKAASDAAAEPVAPSTKLGQWACVRRSAPVLAEPSANVTFHLEAEEKGLSCIKGSRDVVISRR